MFAALAQLERDIIIERTKAGLESARRRGKVLGAPKGISKKNQQKAVLCEEYFKEGKNNCNSNLRKAWDFKGDLLQIFTD